VKSGAAIALAFAATGCVPETFPPPLRPALIEEPRVLDEGSTALRGSAAARLGSGQPSVDAWSVGARHGFGHRVEASLDATYFHESSTGLTPSSASGEALRLGIRYQFWTQARRHRVGTFFAGTGGGAFDHGGMLGADVGIAIGTDVIYFIGRAWVSNVFGADAVDDGYYSPPCVLFCSPQPDVRYRNVPRTAGGFDGMLGLHATIVETPHAKAEFVLAGGPAIVFAAEPHVGLVGGAGLEYVS